MSNTALSDNSTTAAADRPQVARQIGTALADVVHLAEEWRLPDIADEATDLIERLRAGLYYVACLGQFKRGKSTVINALIGSDIMPSGVAPVTSVVTVVRHGKAGARVRIEGRGWLPIPIGDIGQYISEQSNPQNCKHVRGLEVFFPSPLLADGLCLVDTPGIGSVFEENTLETIAFIPRIDAAIVVLGGDPPISGEELKLIESIRPSVNQLVFVLNKSDRLSDDERRQARQFSEDVLSRHLSQTIRLLEISALHQLNAATTPDDPAARDWPKLVHLLKGWAGEERDRFVEIAARRGMASLITRLEQQLQEDRGALLRPIGETDARIQLLQQCATNAEQALIELKHLFNAEEENLMQRFDQDRTRYIAATRPLVERDLDAFLQTMVARPRGQLRKTAILHALETCESHIRAWLVHEKDVAERAYKEVTDRFIDHTHAFLDRLKSSGAFPDDVDILFALPVGGLSEPGRYHFVSLTHRAKIPLWRAIADRFCSRATLLRDTKAEAIRFAGILLEANTNRVLDDFYQRMVESRRHVEAGVRRALMEVVDRARSATERTAELKALGAAAIRDELARIGASLETLEQLRVTTLENVPAPADAAADHAVCR